MSAYDRIQYIVIYAAAFHSVLPHGHAPVSLQILWNVIFYCLDIYFNYIIYLTILLAHGLYVYIHVLLLYTITNVIRNNKYITKTRVTTFNAGDDIVKVTHAYIFRPLC